MYVCALWEIPAKQKSVQSERDQYEQVERESEVLELNEREH